MFCVYFELQTVIFVISSSSASSRRVPCWALSRQAVWSGILVSGGATLQRCSGGLYSFFRPPWRCLLSGGKFSLLGMVRCTVGRSCRTSIIAKVHIVSVSYGCFHPVLIEVRFMVSLELCKFVRANSIVAPLRVRLLRTSYQRYRWLSLASKRRGLGVGSVLCVIWKGMRFVSACGRVLIM